MNNNVVVPDKPLSDFDDWDRKSRAVLTKLAAFGSEHKVTCWSSEAVGSITDDELAAIQVIHVFRGFLLHIEPPTLLRST